MIESSENLIKGEFTKNIGEVEKDPTNERIRTLTGEFLIKIGTDESGWDTLFQDPQDKRYWELTYPHSGYHGGGGATAACVFI